MTKKAKKPDYSVAMSKDTGCVVMVRTNGAKATVIGALTREDSLNFADGLIDWEPEVIAPAEVPAPRQSYPH
jgi:hypothetical protein